MFSAVQNSSSLSILLQYRCYNRILISAQLSQLAQLFGQFHLTCQVQNSGRDSKGSGIGSERQQAWLQLMCCTYQTRGTGFCTEANLGRNRSQDRDRTGVGLGKWELGRNRSWGRDGTGTGIGTGNRELELDQRQDRRGEVVGDNLSLKVESGRECTSGFRWDFQTEGRRVTLLRFELSTPGSQVATLIYMMYSIVAYQDDRENRSSIGETG